MHASNLSSSPTMAHDHYNRNDSGTTLRQHIWAEILVPKDHFSDSFSDTQPLKLQTVHCTLVISRILIGFCTFVQIIKALRHQGTSLYSSNTSPPPTRERGGPGASTSCANGGS